MSIQSVGPVQGKSIAAAGGATDVAVVIASVTTATGLTVLRQLLDSKLSMRPIIGGFVVGTMLLVLALFNTSIAVALSLLLLVSSVLNNGVPVLTKVMNRD